jgi:cytochrome c oxidase assembly factor CtaG
VDPVLSAREALLRSWPVEPTIVLALVALLAAWAGAVRRWGCPPPARTAALLAGVLLLALALLSPLDTLADRYLFTAHMLQHLLLLLVVPPLLWLGAPPRALVAALRWQPFTALERGLGRPLVAVALFTLVVTTWHAPALYEWALAQPTAHALEHVSFLGTALLYWWLVLWPGLSRARLAPLGRMGYLFAACVPNTVLGAVLAFASAPLYPTYASTADSLGLFPLTRGAWGLDPLTDQQLGGLLMWLPGGLVYLGAIGVIFVRWHGMASDEAPLADVAAQPRR